MSETVDAPAAREIREAAAELEAVESELDEYGEEAVETVAEARRSILRLLDRYEDSAVGTGDFGDYVQAVASVVNTVENLDDELPERDAFAAARKQIDRRRLSEKHFRRAREALEPTARFAELLDEREAARDRLHEARIDATRRLEAIDGAVADCERLLELGEADLDAPVEELRDPVGRWNDAVRAGFATFRAESSAREVFSLLDRARLFPFVPFEEPPAELREYVGSHPDGALPVPDLLEYAGYSRSKLTHYVEDADRLKRTVATQRTALERIDAEPLTLPWPPDPPGVVTHRVREVRAVGGRLVDEDALAALRAVADLARDRERYAYLREAARALESLDERDRERLRSGAVEDEREVLEAERAAIEAALAETPDV